MDGFNKSESDILAVLAVNAKNKLIFWLNLQYAIIDGITLNSVNAFA
jgi:hypothetical protein